MVVDADRRKLDESVTHAHQGVIAVAAVREYASSVDIFQRAGKGGENPLIVLCRQVSDPHNLGADPHRLLIPKRHSAGPTAVVVKTSAGAVPCIPVARVPNLTALLNELKERGV